MRCIASYKYSKYKVIDISGDCEFIKVGVRLFILISACVTVNAGLCVDSRIRTAAHGAPAAYQQLIVAFRVWQQLRQRHDACTAAAKGLGCRRKPTQPAGSRPAHCRHFAKLSGRAQAARRAAALGPSIRQSQLRTRVLCRVLS